VNNFIELLNSKDNRLVWGGMMALDYITPEKPKIIYNALPKIIDAVNKGSVISRDHCVGILIGLCSFKQYLKEIFPLLLEQLSSCPTNQLPMYAENCLPVINDSNKKSFIETLQVRIKEVEKESQKKRIEKAVKKINAGTLKRSSK
jgi:hypothetical protein